MKKEMKLKVEEQSNIMIPITNDYMFGEVMRVPEIYRQVLEIILEESVDSAHFSNTQQSMEGSNESHGIRMDAYMENKTAMYNSEMQTSNQNTPILRARYNSSMMDVNNLKSGESYAMLKENYVIFICKFDPLKKGKCKYVFTNQEEVVERNHLNDGTKKIFINLMGTDINVNDELKELIDYMAGVKCVDDCKQEIIKKIHAVVVATNNDEKWRKEYMRIEQEMQMREAYGKAEGEKIGIKTLIDALCETGMSLDDAIQKASEKYRKSYGIIVEMLNIKVAE